MLEEAKIGLYLYLEVWLIGVIAAFQATGSTF